ncbi:hypothetical protein Gasu2_13810 [Galdieria sulphuraria]|uniref:GDP-fucose protein O-fucosyltransferase 2 n=1 Tax=Galdieria sulphuraria TaxID=130081 RepID=M2XSS7_GALSU|nr:uncharacterized protein Gasu_56220 [Galdieria sulphuraria]EME26723.1 hypothetical protein Gasu_56220 [Galdieria sulphuraria]GJD06997.1 hypothetical protein Gasu2_13810 [Galdieria sulphuraria]|eukprot:XP_005703243.1 hypothetical protein Gasu_56220 [Galdieria sulphuraria]
MSLKKKKSKQNSYCFRAATFLVAFCIGLVFLSFSTLDKGEIAIRYSTHRAIPNRYVLYDSRYGSFNNQLNSLINSLVIAKNLNATLVLGYAYTPGGGHALRDDRHSNHSYLVGHYFDAKLLNSVQPILEMDDYLKLYDSKRSLSLFVESTEESNRNGDYYQSLGVNVTIQRWYAQDSLHVCERILGRGKRIWTICQGQQKKDCDTILLGFSFTNLYNCTWYDEWWYQVRNFIRPKDVIQQSIQEFVSQVRHPLLVVHVRFVGGSDAANHTFYSNILQHLKRYESEYQENIGSIYMVGMKDKRQSIRVDESIRYLSKRLTQVDWYTCANLTNCAESSHRNQFYDQDNSAFRGYYGVILLDQWMGVESDYFIGRSASTFSQNIVYWRSLKGDSTNYLLY